MPSRAGIASHRVLLAGAAQHDEGQQWSLCPIHHGAVDTLDTLSLSPPGSEKLSSALRWYLNSKAFFSIPTMKSWASSAYRVMCRHPFPADTFSSTASVPEQNNGLSYTNDGDHFYIVNGDWTFAWRRTCLSLYDWERIGRHCLIHSDSTPNRQFGLVQIQQSHLLSTCQRCHLATDSWIL